MNIKALIEKKNELKEEYRSLIEKASIEKRDLKGDVREAEITDEIAKINNQIKEAEERSKKEAGKIETTSSVEEKREMENTITKEVELRAVDQFIRRKFDGEELRAVTEGATPGSLAVPTHLSGMIVEKLYEVAPLFSRARNFTPVNGNLDILRETDINAGNVGFVGEMTNLTPGDFTMSKITLTQKRVGTAIELSQQMVNDAGIDVIGYAINLLSRRLGMTLDRTILIGTPATQFEGLLGSVAIGNVTSAAPTAITIDDLQLTYNSLHPAYLDGAVWVVNRNTFNKIAQLKDGMGRYYLTPPDIMNNRPSYMLFGAPVLINDVMNDIAAASRSVLFGNFAQGYATMTKKGLNLQHVSGDTTQALRGSHMIMLDGYMDGKIYNEAAFKFLIQHV